MSQTESKTTKQEEEIQNVYDDINKYIVNP